MPHRTIEQQAAADRGNKICYRCKKEKSLDEFYARIARCKECQAEYQREYRARPGNREKKNLNRKLHKFNISKEMYDAMVELQEGLCAICGEANPDGRSLAIDHDHSCCDYDGSCGKCIRGLLCGGCNKGMGLLRDNPRLLIKAAEYLLNKGDFA